MEAKVSGEGEAGSEEIQGETVQSAKDDDAGTAQKTKNVNQGKATKAKRWAGRTGGPSQSKAVHGAAWRWRRQEGGRRNGMQLSMDAKEPAESEDKKKRRLSKQKTEEMSNEDRC